MSRYPEHLEKLIAVLRRLPGVGTRSAERYAFHMLSWKEGELKEMAQVVEGIPEKLKTCAVCGCLGDGATCRFCVEGPVEMLCVIAEPRDAFSVASTGEFRGAYHVLGGVLSPIHGRGPECLRLEPLKTRIKALGVKEVVIALDSTLEGDTTALYLKKELEPYDIRISRLALGLPMGSSLDYVDGSTLARALTGRATF